MGKQLGIITEQALYMGDGFQPIKEEKEEKKQNSKEKKDDK